MSEVSLTARLTDQVSGPARAGASALKEEAGAAKQLEAALKANDATAIANSLKSFAAEHKARAEASKALLATRETESKLASFASAKWAGFGANQGSISGINATSGYLSNFVAEHKAKAEASKELLAMRETEEKLARYSSAKWGGFGGASAGPAGGKTGGFAGLVNIVGSKLGAGAADNLMQLGQMASSADAALGKVGLSLGSVVGIGAAAAAAIVAVGVAIGMVIFKVAELAAKGAMAFTKMTVESGVFRENTLISLATMLKSQEAADRVYASAIKVARETPLETQQVIDAYTKMLAGGFKEADLEPMMRGISDFTSALGPEKMDQVVRAFARIKTEGRLGGEAVQSLADAGLPIQDLMTKLGAKSMQDLYGMDGAKALAAIMETINERFGGLSEARSKSLGGLWSSLSSAPFELWSAAFEKTKNSGTGVTALYDTIKSSVSDLLGIASGQGGERAVAIINAIGGGLAAVATILKSFGTGLLEGFLGGLKSSGALKEFEKVSQLRLDNIAGLMKELGQSLGVAAGYAVMLAFGLQVVARFMSENIVILKVIGVLCIVVAAAFTIMAVAITILVVAVFILLAPLWVLVTVIGAIVGVVFLVAAAIVGGIVAAVVGFALVLWNCITAIAGFVSSIVSADDPLAALGKALESLGGIVVDSVKNAFASAIGAAVSAAGSLGSSAAQAFSDAFKPSIDMSFLGGFGGLGGLGGMQMALPEGGFPGTGPSPYGNMTLTAPSGAFPSVSSMPQQSIPTDKSRGDTNVHVSVSGVGKTDEDLAWFVVSKIKDELKKGAGT